MILQKEGYYAEVCVRAISGFRFQNVEGLGNCGWVMVQSEIAGARLAGRGKAIGWDLEADFGGGHEFVADALADVIAMFHEWFEIWEVCFVWLSVGIFLAL